MEGKTITIFTYCRPLIPPKLVNEEKLQSNYFFQKWLSPKKQDEIMGDKGGNAAKMHADIIKVDKSEIMPQQPEELIQIKEPKNFNIRITSEREELQILANLRKKSNRLLITFSSVFPWEFFPTKITIQETKVSVIFHDFLSTQVHSMDIKDISNVFIESAYLFANLKIITRTFIENDVKVNKLKKSDAI